MTQSTKSLIFLFLSLLIISCTPQNGDKKEAATEAITPSSKTTTITGLVQSITNGKDGYTAQVETKDSGTYNALVSIVNLGGPDNYVRFNIGDRVTLSGQASVLNGQEQLRVEKIINVEPSRTTLLISETSFRGITIGDKIADHSAYIQKETLQTGEGSFEVYRIKDFNNNPVGHLDPHPKDESLVGDITVESPKAVTEAGIKIGDTFKDLQAKAKNIAVHGSEIEGRTYATVGNIAYRLDMANFTYEVDMSKIPADTKITEIMINRK